jgi:hypothetical protein
MRAIVLSILDAMFELGAYLEQRHAGPGRPVAPKPAARRRKAAPALAPRRRAVRRHELSLAAAPPAGTPEPEN